MKTDLTLLLKELQKLAAALPDNDKLLIQEHKNGLICQFLMRGLVQRTVPVRSSILVTAMLQASVKGILEGTTYTAFRETFGWFALHVKATALYEELRYSMPEYHTEFQNSQVA